MALNYTQIRVIERLILFWDWPQHRKFALKLHYAVQIENQVSEQANYGNPFILKRF